MQNWQQILILIYALLAFFSAILGYKKCRFEKNNLGIVGFFTIYGAFVWADVVVFGIFWFLFSLVTIFLGDWVLFLLGLSLFWLVRSIGETIYWFNQQFSTIQRYRASDFPFLAKIFHNDYTVYFVLQICMQCVTVVSAILSIYLTKLWLFS